jgi:hypothetical protein
MMKKTLLPLLLTATLWGYGDGVIYWAPHISHGGEHSHNKQGENDKHGGDSHSKHAQHGEQGMGETTMLHAMNCEGNSSVTLIKSDLSKEDLNLSENTLNLPKVSVGGYYALILNHHTDTRVDSALRYLSMKGSPSKVSPSKLTVLPKTDLEIIPDPLRSEHSSYMGSETYRFIAKFEGKLLTNTPIILETQKSGAKTFITNSAGIAQITLPNDFKNVQLEKRKNKPSEFLLTLQYDKVNTHYTTTLSMPYSANPNDFWQSQSYGAGAIFIGFLGGLIIYRRQTTKGVKRG